MNLQQIQHGQYLWNIFFSRRSIWVSCFSTFANEHNTLPKSTRRNVKLNKFAFGTAWLPELSCKHWFKSSVWNLCRWVADVPPRENDPQRQWTRRNVCRSQAGVFHIIGTFAIRNVRSVFLTTLILQSWKQKLRMIDNSLVWILMTSRARLAKRERAWKSPHTRIGVSPFLAWGDFHARSRFARSILSEEKWGTTRSLVTCKPAINASPVHIVTVILYTSSRDTLCTLHRSANLRGSWVHSSSSWCCEF